MTWTYSWNFNVQKDRVRREIGDVLSTDQLLSDEEIQYAGTAESSDLGVAARCCEWLWAVFARKADMQEGKLRIWLNQRAKEFKDKAVQLRALDATGSIVYLGGESISDKQATNDDTDRVQPGAWRDMLDNPQSEEVSPGSIETSDDD